jgi:hypothetical protein
MIANQGSTEPRRASRESLVWPVALTLMAFFVAHRSPVSYTLSDPLGTLLTAEALVQHGTISLDHYAAASGPTYLGDVDDLREDRGKFRLQEGHVYHFAPLGTAFLSAPFVWLNNLRGPRMLNPQADAAVQNTLSAVTVAIAFVLVYLIARYFIAAQYSAVFAAGCVFGGPLMSTMGTALWSSNLAVVFVLWALLFLVRRAHDQARGSGLLFGAVLFLAYLCQPTTLIFAILAIPSLLFIGERRKRRLALSAISFLLLMATFVIFSLAKCGTFLPDYYMTRWFEKPSRYLCIALLGAGMFGAVVMLTLRALMSRRMASDAENQALRRSTRRAAVLSAFGVLVVALILGKGITEVDLENTITAGYGLLLSPSRGLIVFSPFLVIAGIASLGILARKQWSPLSWLCFVWLVVHTLMLARPHRWYGGHCYGPRLFTEALPAVILLTFLAWRSFESLGKKTRRAFAISMSFLMLVSVFINTYQGVYNRHTTAWNTSPNIDSFPENLFDWRYPQFLASPAQLDARNEAHDLKIRLQRRREREAGGVPREPSGNGAQSATKATASTMPDD